jgi:hypothetical protein
MRTAQAALVMNFIRIVSERLLKGLYFIILRRA